MDGIVPTVDVALTVTTERRTLRLEKTDDDTWIIIIRETRSDGDELRAICKNRNLFLGSGTC
jgi:hypothetical protein